MVIGPTHHQIPKVDHKGVGNRRRRKPPPVAHPHLKAARHNVVSQNGHHAKIGMLAAA